MRGVVFPVLVLLATGSFCVAMYQIFSRDYQYLQLIKLGDQLLEEDLPFQAARTYDSAINLRPDKALGLLKRAEAHQRQGDLALALDDLLKASELSADVLTVSRRLADIYYARNQFEDAARHYAEALAIDPDSPSVLYQLALACFRASREAEAVNALDRAVALQENYPEAYYLRGAILRSLGREDEAEADFLRVLSLRPDADEARSALLDLYLDVGAGEKALELVQEEIERQPQDPASYLRLADVQRLRGRPDETIEAVGLALEQDPNLPQAYLRLGELWLEEATKRGDRVAAEKAVAALESAAKMDPANGRIALALGRACLAMGDEERGFSELQRAAEATPIQASAHRLLGDIYLARSDHAEAVTAYHIYLKLMGDNPSILEKLGDAYQGMGNTETAAGTYVQLTSLEPNRVTPFIKAARAFIAAGKPEEAVLICRRGLSSNPNNQALQALLSQATH